MLAALLAALLRAAAWTWRFDRSGDDVEGDVVYAFLHGELLPLTLAHVDRGITGMVSRSRDGERLAGVLTRLGYAVVRGSSSRGGVAALLEGTRGEGSVALAVDGPRGPAGVAKPGAAFIASRRHHPLVCVRADCAWALRVPSWDRFMVPLPFARIGVRYRVLDVEGLEVEALTRRVEGALDVDSGA